MHTATTTSRRMAGSARPRVIARALNAFNVEGSDGGGETGGDGGDGDINGCNGIQCCRMASIHRAAMNFSPSSDGWHPS